LKALENIKVFIVKLSIPIFKNRLLTYGLFRIRFLPLQDGDHYFDLTTILLIRILKKYIDSSSTVLDLGTGAYATVGLSLLKQVGCKVICADVDESLIRKAQANIEFNHADLQAVQSDFFSRINHEFDYVVFNPPYVPIEVGEDVNLPDSHRVQWDGGTTGTNVIDGFLDACKALPASVKVFMGVNRWYVSEEKIVELARLKNIRIREIHKPVILPANIYILDNS
jgi:methylase of polypeptide subunit release factors